MKQETMGLVIPINKEQMKELTKKQKKHLQRMQFTQKKVTARSVL